MSVAVVFPGQGSQIVGMGADLMDVAEAKQLFQRADDVLGYKLSEIMLNGPDDELKMTVNTQPALLVHSIALWNQIKEKVKPAYFAGHSLGEYTAVTAAGGISIEDAVRTVNQRGKYMQSSVPVGVGGMAAVLGADDAVVTAVCKEVSMAGDIVEPANFNTNGQVVVAGNLPALERFSALIKEKGAKRVIPLAVSAPFHCSLMKEAQGLMQEYLKNVAIKRLDVSIINNIDASVESDADTVRDALVKQMSGSVKWTQSVNKMIELGVTKFIEVGSGSVLTGLIKKISKDVEVVNISTYADIQKLG